MMAMNAANIAEEHQVEGKAVTISSGKVDIAGAITKETSIQSLSTLIIKK